VRILLTKWFKGFAKSERITDSALKALVAGIEDGIRGASLGSGLFKYRLAKPGKGKSGGHRVIVCMKRGERLFFVYGFSKSGQENLSDYELKTYKKFAEYLLSLDDASLDYAVAEGRLTELEEGGT
jgi:hypothetical protein